jgi:Flp pilus assembly protein TadG
MLYLRPLGPGGRRPGIVAPFVALLLVALLGVTAIAIDGGMLLVDKRRAQGAADAAALAGAVDLFQNFATNQGKDTSGTAATSARDTATDNGFTNGVNGTTVTVNIPPKSGIVQGVDGYVEVLITMQQQRYFSGIFGSGTLPVNVRSVARGSKAPKNNGIIILDPKDPNSLTTTASGNVVVQGGNVIVDSSNATGGTISSTGNIEAENLYFTGTPGYGTSNSGKFIATNGSIYSNQPPTPDPLASLPAPAQPLPLFTNINISGLPKVGGTIPGWPDPNNLTNGWILPAGTYNNGIHISDNNSAHTYTLQSGLFYFTGGGLTLSANATINCEAGGVCLYFHSGGGLSLTAGGSVTLSPLQSGTYANITIYEDRSNTSQDSITGQSTGSLNVSGTVYTPAAVFTLTGSGGNYAVGSQYIVYQLKVTGSGSFNVDYRALAAPPNRDLYLIE